MLSCFTGVTLPPCGYCLEASMTATLHHPVVSRLRGNDGLSVRERGTEVVLSFVFGHVQVMVL